MEHKLKVASLFCGCGGTDVGMVGGFDFLGKHYESNPVEIVYANDIENSASDIFEKNFDVKVDRRDVREVKADELPDIDILTGGFPCNSFSVVAQNPKRLGVKSDLGKLFFEMCRIIKEKQPACFIAENVKGILSANNGEAFPLIIQEFRNCGYDVFNFLVGAKYYGVPQKRERIIIVGFRKDLCIQDFLLNNPPLTDDNLVPLREVIMDDIPEKYYFSERAVAGMMRVRASMNKGREQDVNLTCNTVGAHLAKVSLNSTDPVLKIGDRYRRFTPREVARIQSFPDSFNLCGADFGQYHALGNAIPPVMFWYVFRDILDILCKHVV